MPPDAVFRRRMTPTERRATLLLAAILVLRMTALFMVLPVLAPFALRLAGEPRLAVGLAVGGYGLTQALLQIPFGHLSDRIGRKPVMLFGMAVFAFGSLLAWQADDIQSLMWARFLQGGGAIAAASTALLSDLVRESVRTTAMAIVGASIGGSFLLALIIGPALLSFTDVPGLFLVSAICAFSAMGLILLLPGAEPLPVQDTRENSVLTRGLLKLDFGVFSLHAILATLFVGLPLMLVQQWEWPDQTHWRLYLPVMLASLIPVFPLIRWLEKRDVIIKAMPPAVFALLLSSLLIAQHWLWMPAALWLFFCAFNLLEASLPSQVAKLAPPGARGRAMGVFSSCQFFGAFAGASVAGLVLSIAEPDQVVLSAAAWGSVWLITLLVRQRPENSLSNFKPAPDARETH